MKKQVAKPEKSFKEQYLELTTESNALDYLEKAHFFIKQTQVDVCDWKWVSISLHGALYGFAIAVSHGTNWESVTVKRKDGYHIIGFNAALKRCQDGHYAQGVGDKALEISESQKESIRKLKSLLRDRFEHYLPMSWYIETHGMPQICIDVLNVIEYVAIDCSMYVRGALKEKGIRKVRSLVSRSRKTLQKSQLFRDLEKIQQSQSEMQ